MNPGSKRRKALNSPAVSEGSPEPSTSYELGSAPEHRVAFLPRSKTSQPAKKASKPATEDIGGPVLPQEPYYHDFASIAPTSRTPLDYYTPSSSTSVQKPRDDWVGELPEGETYTDEFATEETESILQHYIPTTTYVANQLSNIALYKSSSIYGYPTTSTILSSVMSSTSRARYAPTDDYDEQEIMIGKPAVHSSKDNYGPVPNRPSAETVSDLSQSLYFEEEHHYASDPFHNHEGDDFTAEESLPPNLNPKPLPRVGLRSRMARLKQPCTSALPSTPRIVPLGSKDTPPVLEPEAPTCSSYRPVSPGLSLDLPVNFIGLEEEESDEESDEATQADTFLKEMSKDVDKSQPLGVDLERLLESAKQKGLQFLRRGLKKGKGRASQLKHHLKECIFIEKNRRLQKLSPTATLFGVKPFKDVTQKNIFSYFAKKYPWAPKSDRPKSESTLENFVKQEELVEKIMENAIRKLTSTFRYRMNLFLSNLTANLLEGFQLDSTPEQLLLEQLRKGDKQKLGVQCSSPENDFITIQMDDKSTLRLSTVTVALIYWFTNKHEHAFESTTLRPSTSRQLYSRTEDELANSNADIGFFEKNSEAASIVTNRYLNHCVVLSLLACQAEQDKNAELAVKDNSLLDKQKELATKRMQEALEELKLKEKQKEQEIKKEEKARSKEERQLQLEMKRSERKSQKLLEKKNRQIAKERAKEEKKAKDLEHRNYVKRIQEEMRQQAKFEKEFSKGPAS